MFQCFSVAVIAYRVATFNDCEEAASELQKVNIICYLNLVHVDIILISIGRFHDLKISARDVDYFFIARVCFDAAANSRSKERLAE